MTNASTGGGNDDDAEPREFEALVDEGSAESFPASDTPATSNPSRQVGPPPAEVEDLPAEDHAEPPEYEDIVDEGSADSFPASDPPSASNPSSRVGPPPVSDAGEHDDDGQSTERGASR